MTSTCSMSRIAPTMRLAFAVAVLSAALALAAPSFAADPTIPAGVTIQGILVENMTADQARTAVHDFASTPFTLRFRTRTWRATPWQVGASSHVNEAVAAALAAAPGTNVPLHVSIDSDRLRHYTTKQERLLSRLPRDTRVHLHHLRPQLSKARRGYDVLERPTRLRLRSEIKANGRGPVPVQFSYIEPKVTRSNFKAVVVIHRGSHALYLYSGPHMRLRAHFGVAVGQPIYPTPTGKFTIVTKQRNPWWYPPDTAWAAGASPIPPGPGNPLGTRWMGLSASGVGIHGTPDAASIGYSASHGCIRMRIPDAEWLFERVEVGSTVFIVRA